MTAIKKPCKRYSARGTCCTRACSLFTRAFHRNSQHARAHAHTEASCVRACASTNAFALAASYLHHKASPLSWPTYPTPRRLITPGSVQIKRVTPRRNPDARPSATLFPSSEFDRPLVFSFVNFKQTIGKVKVFKSIYTEAMKHARQEIHLFGFAVRVYCTYVC